MATTLTDLRHPTYVSNQMDWEKWRLTYESGSRFLQRYLKRYNNRENPDDFERRKEFSYIPAFAKAAVNEVKNSIFQRLVDITREGGSPSYQKAVHGSDGGVDLEGSTMNTFMGRNILPELLTMARVGIYVDMPPLPDKSTVAQKGNKRPYLYYYQAEDILSWTTIKGSMGSPVEFSSLLLRDNSYECDPDYHLPYGSSSRFRYLYIGEDGFVKVQYFDKSGELIYPDEFSDEFEITLKLQRIPFILLRLTDSLLADVADYQIALMNLCSSDLAFALKSSYPFYTEQVDFATMMPYMKQAHTMASMDNQFDPTANIYTQTAEKQTQITLGTSHGRRYGKGTDRPQFIAPPVEPLLASMEKETQIKNEIRELVMLAVSNLTTQRQSADSKDADDDGLEAGLSYIGIELERAERQIAEFWSLYEGYTPVPTVVYPENYSLLSEEQRREAALALKDTMKMVPSLIYRREIAKRIARVIIGTKVSREKLKAIEAEIDAADVVMGDPADIEKDVAGGICDPDTAAIARGYPKGTAKKAEEAQGRRLALIAEHQSKPGLSGGDPGARGISDASADPNAAKTEKKETQKPSDTSPTTKDQTRGTTT